MHVGGGRSLLSAQPEVDDFDGLFAVIVRRGREREGERVFPLAPHEEVGTFSGNITFPPFLLPHSLSFLLPYSCREISPLSDQAAEFTS